MRRKDREITDFNAMLEILDSCDSIRICLNNEEDGYPYIIPLNYGYVVENEKVTLYFHGASEGMKYDLMKKDNRASFEMDYLHELVGNEGLGYCTMAYRSLIGNGKMSIVTSDDEKLNGLNIICNHYYKNGFKFSTDALPRTNVFKLEVSKMTAKERKKPNMN